MEAGRGYLVQRLSPLRKVKGGGQWDSCGPGSLRSERLWPTLVALVLVGESAFVGIGTLRPGGLLIVSPFSAAPLLLVVLALRCRWWNVAVFCRWSDASFTGLVENEHGRTPLQAGVSSLAGPVPVAGLAQGHVTVGVVLAQS